MKQRYDSYKPSGIDWIGDIPSHWKIMPIKYVLDNLDYLRQPISAEDRERNNPQYDYYGASGVIDQIDYYNVEDNVLLIGEDGANLVMRNLPLIYKASGKFWVNNHAHILKPKNGYDYSYLAHLLEAGDYTLFITGSAQPKLSQENLNKYPICIPPLAEQEAIAAWLDTRCGEIDAAIAKVDREIELIDELKQSEISRVVTNGLNPDAPLRPSGIDWIGDIPQYWQIKRLRYVCEFRNGYTPSKANDEFWSDGTIPWYRMEDIRESGRFLKEAKQYISTEAIKGCGLFEGGSFILATTATIGEHAMLIVDSLANQRFTNLKIRKSLSHPVTKEFFFYFLFVIDEFCKSTTKTTTFPAMDMTDLKNFGVPIPPLTEQQAIADYLDKKCAEIDGLKAKLTKKRETLTELRQSIISEVVTGKRKVV